MGSIGVDVDGLPIPNTRVHKGHRGWHLRSTWRIYLRTMRRHGRAEESQSKVMMMMVVVVFYDGYEIMRLGLYLSCP